MNGYRRNPEYTETSLSYLYENGSLAKKYEYDRINKSLIKDEIVFEFFTKEAFMSIFRNLCLK